LQVT
jgi:hypothetical protein